VVETIRRTLPSEIDYLRRFDQAKARIEAFVELPDATFDLLLGFLRQNGGRLSKRARGREFEALTDEEVDAIEGIFQDLFPQAVASDESLRDDRAERAGQDEV